MDFFSYFHNKIKQILEKINNEKQLIENINDIVFVVETPKNYNHGDISTNIAMVCAKYFKTKPLTIAEEFKKHILELSEVEQVDIAGAGFINLKVSNSFWQESLKEVLQHDKNYGRVAKESKEKINLEYVSANPTGPLHIGHGRGAIIGNVLANLYRYLGYHVLEEYYVNDAGNQVEVLGRSLYFRYLEQLGKEATFDKGTEFYPGDYLIPIAKEIVAKDGDKWLKEDLQVAISYMKDYAIVAMLKLIKEDLATIGVKHDVFVSEREVANDKDYNETIKQLELEHYVYKGILNPPKGKQVDDFEPREQKLFKTTLFGDDIDRPLEKSNGERTYFANDVINHNSKVKRGYTTLLTILGADHIGYVKRIEASVAALSNNKARMVAVCCQLVNLLDNGNPIRMSKRAGNFVTLKSLIDEVGGDIFRFMMITRKNDVTIDFDLAKVKEQNNDNPLYYIQYAYARICSVIRLAKEEFTNIDYKKIKKADVSLLDSEYEINVIKQVLKLSRVLDSAQKGNDPHKLYNYLLELAQIFHSLWNRGNEDSTLRFIIKNNENLTIARLSLLQALANVFEILTKILGVNLRETM